MTRIISRTFASISDSGMAEYAFIDITPELVALIMRRKALWDEVQAKDDLLNALEFFDYTPEFWDSLDGLTEQQDGFIADNGWTYADDSNASPEGAVGVGEKCRTDLDRIVINDSGVYWSAVVKHTDVIVETQWLEWSDLKAIVELHQLSAEATTTLGDRHGTEIITR